MTAASRLPPSATAASRVLVPLLTGLAYFAMAHLSLVLTEGPDGIATIWPASGLLLAVLLATAPRVTGVFATVAAASLAANMLGGASLRAALAFTSANLFESALAAMLLRRLLGARPPSFVRARDLGIFCATSVLAATGSAMVSAVLSGRSTVHFVASWFATDLLGILIVTPILLIAHAAWQERHARRRTMIRPKEAALVLALLVGITFLTFAQSSYAAFFLPMAVLLLAVFRLGVVGAAAGMLAIAAISSTLTGLGIGPVTLLHATQMERIQFLQLYLLTLFAAALPVAALLDQRERLIAELGDRNRLLHYAETAANLGHWRLALADWRLFVSDEVYRIYGLEPSGSFKLEEALRRHHPDDAPLARATVDEAIRTGRPYEFRSRVIRPDASQRHVVVRGECERDEHGQVIGVFGMIQDVTRQAEDTLSLEQARLTAEQAAQTARAIADTDPLTGLPNRRMALRVLDAALDEVERSGEPLSIGLLDIDHFKLVNDRHGHMLGDAMLRHIARGISAALRTTDLVGRYGGEEFLLVLPNSTAQTAAAIAERVREAIEQGGTDAPQGLRATASIGVAVLGAGETLEPLLRRADAALYEAKSGGRNQVRVALPGEPTFVEAVRLVLPPVAAG